MLRQRTQDVHLDLRYRESVPPQLLFFFQPACTLSPTNWSTMKKYHYKNSCNNALKENWFPGISNCTAVSIMFKYKYMLLYHIELGQIHNNR